MTSMATNEDSPITPDEVREEFDLVEQVGSRLGVDDDYLAAILTQQARIYRLEKAQKQLLQSLGGSIDQTDVVGQFPIEMSHEVPADTPMTDPVETTRVADEENRAHVTAVSLGWQSGTQNSVGIQLSTGNGLKLLPRNPEDEYIAFDDFNDTWGLDYVLDSGEELIARTVNFDEDNPHFVNIAPHIEELDESR